VRLFACPFGTSARPNLALLRQELQGLHALLSAVAACILLKGPAAARALRVNEVAALFARFSLPSFCGGPPAAHERHADRTHVSLGVGTRSSMTIASDKQEHLR
jgi:hypothetical protein